MCYAKYVHHLSIVLVTAAICLPSLAQDKPDKKKDEKPAGAPSEADMAAMMELSKPGENHKLLASGVGKWRYTVKMWMNPDPNAPPTTFTGTSVVKPVMGGRYFISEHTGKMQMPGPDGKSQIEKEADAAAKEGKAADLNKLIGESSEKLEVGTRVITTELNVAETWLLTAESLKAAMAMATPPAVDPGSAPVASPASPGEPAVP